MTFMMIIFALGILVGGMAIANVAMKIWAGFIQGFEMRPQHVLGMVLNTIEKPNFPVVVGSLLMLSSFPLLGANCLSSFIGGSYSELVRLFFIKSGTMFLIVFILGLFILGLGIAWRLASPDSLKKKFSKRSVGKLIRKEISSKKK